ncbi:NADPH-dependent FMN reductase [Fibrobacter sp. UWB7]|nr:NADPH-dependent FMN reductase [Fibrobacter sp. UWB7]
MSYRVAWLFNNIEFIFIDYSNKLYGNGLGMKILVFSGSPRKGGNTDLLVESFVKGASQKHQVEVVSVHDYKINPCIGCNSCFALISSSCRTWGRCLCLAQKIKAMSRTVTRSRKLLS